MVGSVRDGYASNEFTPNFLDFENSHQHNHASEIGYFCVKLTAIICSFKVSSREVLGSKLQDLHPYPISKKLGTLMSTSDTSCKTVSNSPKVDHLKHVSRRKIGKRIAIVGVRKLWERIIPEKFAVFSARHVTRKL